MQSVSNFFTENAKNSPERVLVKNILCKIIKIAYQ